MPTIKGISAESVPSDIKSPNNQLGTTMDYEGNSKTFDVSAEPTFKPWRVFINHIDSYHGQKLADFLPERAYVNPRYGPAESVMGEEDEETQESESVEVEDEEEEERFREEIKPKTAEPSRNYEVIGTAFDSEYPCPEDVTMIIRDAHDRDALLSELMKCGIIIYDITENDAQVEEARWALKAIVKELEKMEEKAPKSFKLNQEVRYFVLISTIMTWALTKPLSPDDPDVPLTEEDYRKRRPHPKFKDHNRLEKDVVIVKRKTNLSHKLKTLVICCALTYGEGEGPLHYLFKMAWKNAPFLPIFGKGQNLIPLLHVRDLVTLVFTVLQHWPKTRYIVAVEQELSPQSTIVKKISGALSTGRVKNIGEEEAFSFPEVTQRTYDQMTVNLNIDPVYIVDRMAWHLDMPFPDSISAVVKEYKAARNLYPVKIIVLGPPASGKTRVARYLAKHYDIHYVHVKSLIADTIRKLTDEIEAAASKSEEHEGGDKGEDNEEAEEDDEDVNAEDEAANVEELQEELDEIQQNLEANHGRLDDAILNKLFLKRLRSKDCANQGYVIDGYPKTLEQAKELFGGEDVTEEEDIDEEGEITDAAAGNTSILPELVVALEASDEFLKERIIGRPEREIQGTHYTEKHMHRRLKEYRKRNTDENTPLQFFDEIELHPLVIPIENDVCPDMFPTIYQCLEILGKPRNYGLSGEEAKEAQRRAEEEAYAAEMAEKRQKEREISERKRQREEKMMEWTDLMERLKEEEEERLCILGLPLRHYLVRYVFPTLTQGLIEVATLRPEDPVDFLAEYLFKENPEGKMFEPDFTETMSSMLDIIEKFQDDILPSEELGEKVASFVKRESKQVDADGTTDCVISVCTNRKVTPVLSSSESHQEFESMEQEGEISSDNTDDYGNRRCFCDI